MQPAHELGATTVLVAAGAYAPEAIVGPVALVIEGQVIRHVWRGVDPASIRLRVDAELGLAANVVDLGDMHLAPGYIDIHTHGFRGNDITTGPASDAAAMAVALPSTGVTAFLPSIASTGRDETRRQITGIVAARGLVESEAAAEILGIRLEGPFISFPKRGAQRPDAIRPPDPAELDALVELAGGLIRIVDFAPEEDAGLRMLAAMVRHGIIASIGHTSATYAQAVEALDGGARHSTHLFNAMPPLGHRAPGVPGALLTDRRATVEVIADGIHLHPAVLRLVVAARGPQEVAVITDAVGAAGLPDGTYDFVGREVQVRDGAVRLADGTLAGSTLTLDRGVRNLVALAGVPWADAIRMATLTPATILGIGQRKGRIAPGCDADLIALDGQGRVCQTWTRGRPAFSAAVQ